MHQRRPPLSTLRAFRAAAHCLSFTQAAEQLHVTQAAISHQIKSLEQSLGVALFVRGNRSLALSESGTRFLPYIDQMFSLLDQGLKQVRTKDSETTLTVTLLPSFASRWLVPRLGLFLKANPDIDFRLAPSRTITNFQTEDIDLGIRYGSGNYPGLLSIHLMDEEIFPVCSPAIMSGEFPLSCPADLKNHVLLHDDGHGDWRKWLVAARANDVDPDKGPVYTDSAMAVQSAIEGDGIALARSQLVKDDIARGQLIKPFDISQPSNFSYYIIYPEERSPTPAMLAFINWLQEQAMSDAIKYGERAAGEVAQ
jgi:LysR family glycine cleavage system transcriptional activator